MTRELLQQALDALNNSISVHGDYQAQRNYVAAITALEEALAQPVQMSRDEFVARSACVGLSSAVAEYLAQLAPQPPSPTEIIALAKSVGAARSEGYGKWTFTYDQLLTFALKVSHWVHRRK